MTYAELLATARLYLGPDYMSYFNDPRYYRPDGSPRPRVPVGIYCCACKRQYPKREPFDPPGYVDICECGHVMMGLLSMCPTCGIVVEYR